MSTRSFSKYPIGSPEYNAEFAGGKTIAVAAIFIVLEIVLTVMRFISRYMVKTKYALDDAFIIPSLIFCIGCCILAIVMVAIGGVGRHIPYIAQSDPAAIAHWAKALVAVECVYCTAVVFPKLSILSFYQRIFISKPYRMTAYILAFLLTANGIVGVIISLTSCRPLAARWDTTIADAQCIKIDPFWRWISFANIVTDVVMLGLPLPAIWGLQITKNQKIGLSLIFLTGSVGLVSSIVRFAIFFDTEGFIDGTWTSAILMIWTAVEPGVYHFAACLPTLRPLFLYVFKGIRTQTSSRRQTDPYSEKTSLNSKQNNKHVELAGFKGGDSKNGEGFIHIETKLSMHERSSP